MVETLEIEVSDATEDKGDRRPLWHFVVRSHSWRRGELHLER